MGDIIFVLSSSKPTQRRFFVKPSITRLLALLTSLFVTSASFGQTGVSTARNDSPRPRDTAGAKALQPKPTTDSIQKEIKEALSVIENNYGGGKVDYNEVFKSSIDTMLHTLDPHSNYFDSKEYDQFKTDQSSRYFGIGATIGDLSDAQGNVIATYIKATFDGAPAHKAGLRYGDKILEVNGTSMVGKPFSEVRTFLRGQQGTPAKLVVERLSTGKKEVIEIIRDAVPQPSISEIYMIRPGVGYMRMDGGFNQTTYNEFIQGLRDLKGQGMRELILDLRDNGGGLVSRAYSIANAFLSNGQTVFTQKGRIDGVNEQYAAQNPNPDHSPVVMLVNRNTASASEILAGALQDHDRALIVGENTFGKGLVQNPFQLDYGSMLLLTIAKYETPSGRLIQRDYSNGELYNYYTEGGSFRDDDAEVKPKGAGTKTDTGRTVFSGGGINPDVIVKPATIPIERARYQAKLANPIFAFALEAVQGKVKGLETYKVGSPIVFEYDIKATDFPITDALFAAFKQFAVEKYGYTAAQVDREREFIDRTLRTEFVTAAFGSQTSRQVIDGYDNQILKAIDLLPQAKQLALASERARATAASKRPTAN